MKKILKKITSISLAICLSFSVGLTSQASSNVTSNNNYSLINEQLNGKSQIDYPSNKNVVLNIAKKAIKFILKHKKLSMEVVEKVSGKTIAKKFGTHYLLVCDALEPLLELSDVPYQMVYDAVYRTLINADVSSKVAANIALAIKEGISWFV